MRPRGLYWRHNSPPQRGQWAIVSAESEDATWAKDQGFTGQHWPLIKRVAAASGDEICRNDLQIIINQRPAAFALETDFQGRDLPNWQGCRVLKTQEIFLLNAHPHSLDGRYFGATDLRDVAGTGTLIWTFRP